MGDEAKGTSARAASHAAAAPRCATLPGRAMPKWRLPRPGCSHAHCKTCARLTRHAHTHTQESRAARASGHLNPSSLMCRGPGPLPATQAAWDPWQGFAADDLDECAAWLLGERSRGGAPPPPLLLRRLRVPEALQHVGRQGGSATGRSCTAAGLPSHLSPAGLPLAPLHARPRQVKSSPQPPSQPSSVAPRWTWAACSRRPSHLPALACGHAMQSRAGAAAARQHVSFPRGQPACHAHAAARLRRRSAERAPRGPAALAVCASCCDAAGGLHPQRRQRRPLVGRPLVGRCLQPPGGAAGLRSTRPVWGVLEAGPRHHGSAQPSVSARALPRRRLQRRHALGDRLRVQLAAAAADHQVSEA